MIIINTADNTLQYGYSTVQYSPNTRVVGTVDRNLVKVGAQPVPAENRG